MADCKISALSKKPKEDAVMLSTNDASFAHGYVGQYIRSQFPEACEYEVTE